MHSSQQEIHTEIVDDDGEEGTDHVDVVKAGAAEAADRRLVEWDSIDHEGDECPRLFRIPRPVVSPRYIGPDSTKEDTDGKQENGWVEQELRKSRDSLQVGVGGPKGVDA